MNDNSPLPVIELNFASTEAGIEDKIGDKSVIWKDILPEGKFPMLPGMKGKRIPFTVEPTGESSLKDRRITMSDLIESFDQQAFPSGVTIPDGHPKVDGEGNIIDSALNNTGYVGGLRTVKRGDQHVLQAALGFTEPDAAGKAKRGTIPNVSAGILFNWLRKDNNTRFRAALNHVALTKMPWMNVDPFQKVFAADDNFKDNDLEIAVFSFDDTVEGDNTSDNGAEVIWNEKNGANWIREALTQALTPERPQPVEGMPYIQLPEYYVEDVDPADKIALVTEWYKGDKTRYVIPYTKDGEAIKPAPATRWVQGQEALIAASDQIEFEKITPDKIIDKLGVKLADMVDGENFAVESVSFDNRCRIRNKDTGQGFEAEFVRMGTDVMLADAAEWERSDVVAPTIREGGTQPSPAPAQVVSLSDEATPEGRLAAARNRRRALLAVNSH